FCINDLSPRAKELRSSGLPPQMANTYCDPVEFERKGEAYIVDGVIDRRDTEAVKAYLRCKYDCGNILDLNMKHYSAMIKL
ncbi:MAG: hypothetical protein ACO398_11350, partial [Kiritimatiellia bacterium]